MFTSLKQRVKRSLARFLLDRISIEYEAYRWTRTTTCAHCEHLVPINARFCSQCGIRLQEKHTAPEINAVRLAETGQLNVHEVNIILPDNHGRRFLNYVRTRRNALGPATIAHRSRQDVEILS